METLKAILSLNTLKLIGFVAVYPLAVAFACAAILSQLIISAAVIIIPIYLLFKLIGG